MPVSITVVTPSYNQAEYLEETLRSVVAQRHLIHEWFVIDGDLWLRMLVDGSTWGHIPQYLAAFRKHATAKGLSWGEAYAREAALLDARYGQYTDHRLKHRIGVLAYRAAQVLSGRQLA